MPFTLRRTGRIRLRRQIEQLFKEGQSMHVYPIRARWLDIPYDGVTARMMVSVPKKNFKRAVDRNLIKRRIRNAYRLHRDELIVPEDRTRHFAFVCIAKTVPTYAETEAAIRTLLTNTAVR